MRGTNISIINWLKEKVIFWNHVFLKKIRVQKLFNFYLFAETLILSRRPAATKQYGIKKYGDCARCGKRLSLKFLYQHNKRCLGRINHGINRILVQCSWETSLFIRPSAIHPLRTRLIPKLRFPDPITEVICEDEVIIDYGNLQTVKYRESAHIDKMIRARLRRLGKFLIEVCKNQLKNWSVY